MATINMHDAKTQLSGLVARAEAGEEIVIARRNKPAVKLVPVHAPDTSGERRPAGFGENEQAMFGLIGWKAAVDAGQEFTIMEKGKAIARVVPVEPEPKPRGWGAWEGRYRLPDSFFDPLPEEELRAWEGSDEPSP